MLQRVDEKAVEFLFTVRKKITNPARTLHESVLSSMIDDCIGINFMILDLENF